MGSLEASLVALACAGNRHSGLVRYYFGRVIGNEATVGPVCGALVGENRAEQHRSQAMGTSAMGTVADGVEAATNGVKLDEIHRFEIVVF